MAVSSTDIFPHRAWALGRQDRSVVQALTDDDVLLRMERYHNASAQPVLLLHGWMQSPRGMDSPVEGRSVARFLFSRGYDVFVGCMRGHGDGAQRSGSHGHWTPEDHAALDLPAMVRTIRSITGTTPALVGHSLGGLVSLMYAAGARRTQDRIRACPQTASQRNRKLPAVCAIAPPLAFPSRSIGLFSDQPDLAGKLLCSFGASRAGHKLLKRLPSVPLQAGVRRATSAPMLGRAVTAAMVLAASGNNARGFWRPENMTPELVRAELTRTLDATSGAELRQLARWVRGGGLCNEWREALSNVSAPTLVVAGAKDGVSTVDGVLQGSRHIGARTRRFMIVRGAGHNDLRVGHKAVSEVYPALDRWLSGKHQ